MLRCQSRMVGVNTANHCLFLRTFVEQINAGRGRVVENVTDEWQLSWKACAFLRSFIFGDSSLKIDFLFCQAEESFSYNQLFES